MEHLALVAGHPPEALATLLSAQPYPVPLLINADPLPDSAAIIARCIAYAEQTPNSLIVTLFPAAYPGLAHFPVHQATATLWAFTRAAALDWAPRNIRINAVAIGAAPFGPLEADDEAGRPAIDLRAAAAATPKDIAGTIRAIANFPSMTGQIIRLGAERR
jgi:NAD(P)-dependent dehydrogenase (short-subunit alcohol dehydrogenase family)